MSMRMQWAQVAVIWLTCVIFMFVFLAGAQVFGEKMAYGMFLKPAHVFEVLKASVATSTVVIALLATYNKVRGRW